MAQLPPKIPNMQPTWPDFSHQKTMPPSINKAASPTAATGQNPSWVDEFLDFSLARRGTHRRSVSDSIAFLEPPLLEECRGTSGAVVAPQHQHRHSAGHNNSSSCDFDKFDDEQFMSMFNDDISNAVAAPSCSNPSTPSDHNSINDEKDTTAPSSDQNTKQNKIRNEPDEVQSQCQQENQTPPSATDTNSSDRIVDPKRVKRILANRQSAQRSRVRKLQYISELERSVTSLQAEVSVLSPRVAFLDHQRLLLNVDNSALKQRIAALAQDKIFKDAHQEALKREIERLRQVYHQQNLKKMENSATDPTTAPEKEQLLLQV
ncbi:basic leucine zipper 61 isoform X2 [Manihot esculenta]|uniref:BZIP domain-containing protein n=1 Tax=Manihot esculenta TaxID=3983 RepID=A0A2C9UST6_MANES|nr:basic leucine zipper 61 isoform X2 [Manihot esculenta]